METYLQRNSYQLANGSELKLEDAADGFDILDFGDAGGNKFALAVYDRNGNPFELKDSRVSSRREAEALINSHTQELQDNKFEDIRSSEPHSAEYLAQKEEHLQHESKAKESSGSPYLDY